MIQLMLVVVIIAVAVGAFRCSEEKPEGVDDYSTSGLLELQKYPEKAGGRIEHSINQAYDQNRRKLDDGTR